MKHCVSDSMTEVFEPEVVIPCTRSYESILQKLYIDLCNLIVESRNPRFNDRGYGDGIHCLPLLGRSTHICDFSKTECQKHQRLIHHLLRAVENNVFEIEVIVLPDCCTDLKLRERIQKGEYALLERWSMKCIYSKVHSTIDVPELLRAVRSFLHFSQISAWLSSTKGKSPSNIYYWVKSSLDGVLTSFDKDPDVHSFPICKICEDLYGSVKVKYPARTQYVPIIPCSKHPPLHGYSFRTISDTSNLHPNISLNSEIVKQLQKTACDDQNTEQSYVSEPQTLLLTPTTLLKTFSNNASDLNKPNRVVKPYCQDHIINASFNLKECETMDVVLKSQTSYVCNYAEPLNNGTSQEVACLNKSSLNRHLRKRKVKFRKINGDAHHSQETPALSENPRQMNYVSEKCDVSSSIELNNTSSKRSVLEPLETSLTKETYQSHKVLQKKRSSSLEVISQLPHKKMCCDVNVSYKFCKNVPVHFSEVNSKQSSQVRHLSPIYRGVEEGECSSQNSCVKQEIKNSGEKRPSMCSPLSSILLRGKRKLANLKNYKKLRNSDEYFRKILFEEDNSQKINDDACLKGMPVTNEKEKVKLISECNKRFCSTSQAYVDTSNKTEQNISSVNKCLEKKNLLQSKKSKCQKLVHSVCKLRCPKDCPESVSSYNSSYQRKRMNLKKGESFQRNEVKTSLNNFSSDSDPVCFHGNNFRKNNLRRSRAFLSNCKGTDVKEYQESNYESEKNNRNNFNSPGSVLEVKQKKMYKNVKCALKSLKEKNLKNTSERVKIPESEINSLQICNKSCRRREKKKKCNINKSISSQSLAVTKDVASTSCAFKNCHYRYVQRKSVCTKQYSRVLLETNSAPSTSVLRDNFRGLVNQSSGDGEKNCISNGYKWNSDCESKKLPHPSIKLCSCVLNKSIPFDKRYASCKIHKVPGNSLRHISKFPVGKKLLVNFEESILKGCLPVTSNVQGFYAEIGASGSFFPSHLTLPADVSFYDLGNSHQGAAPYVAHVNLENAEYFLPRRGAMQVTLFNPSETVVKMFVLNYDLSTMPPMCHTFIRQKIYYLPVCSTEGSPETQKWLRFIIHLKFASSKSGKIFLFKDFKIVVLNKSNDDAASEFSQEPRELRSFVSVPVNPTFSSF
ncbi:protein FAM214A [Nephila pilipes]|uniref:Protein FAM214A n=1 Tax=Nephila pilipes TaxID=299642 RepID=A0A8X6NP56_NEPPI|nr:protein FAM214A [Nephila pilipes]